MQLIQTTGAYSDQDQPDLARLIYRRYEARLSKTDPWNPEKLIPACYDSAFPFLEECRANGYVPWILAKARKVDSNERSYGTYDNLAAFKIAFRSGSNKAIKLGDATLYFTLASFDWSDLENVFVTQAAGRITSYIVMFSRRALGDQLVSISAESLQPISGTDTSHLNWIALTALLCKFGDIVGKVWVDDFERTLDFYFDPALIGGAPTTA